MELSGPTHFSAIGILLSVFLFILGLVFRAPAFAILVMCVVSILAGFLCDCLADRL